MFSRVLLAVACLLSLSVSSAQAAPPDYAVHEWGLITYGPQVVEVATSGHALAVDPPTHVKPTHPPVMKRKPLIYFHPGAAFDYSTVINAKIEVSGGRLREVWPTPGGEGQPAHGGAFEWTGLKVMEAGCGAEKAPEIKSKACQSLKDGVCEAAEMKLYLKPVDHCLVTGDGVETPVLVYNGTTPAEHDSAPLSRVVAELRDRNAMASPPKQMTNGRPHPVGPVYFLESVTAAGVTLRRAETIAAGATVTVASLPEVTGGHAGQLKAIRGDLLSGGLTEREADDFMAAWAPDLLASPFPWQVLGFLSRPEIDATLPLTLTPSPRELVRVMAFTIARP